MRPRKLSHGLPRSQRHTNKRRAAARIDDAGAHHYRLAGMKRLQVAVTAHVHGVKTQARQCNSSWRVGQPTAAHRGKWAAALATLHQYTAIIYWHGSWSDPRLCRRRDDSPHALRQRW
jgi:hypothetical protein